MAPRFGVRKSASQKDLLLIFFLNIHIDNLERLLNSRYLIFLNLLLTNDLLLL
jgi:hypothetical protein